MQIVIDISEDVYNYIKANGARIPYYKLTDAIKKGIPLPKGHGRLIDADELELDADWDDYDDGYIAYSESMIKYASTIIEADKES